MSKDREPPTPGIREPDPNHERLDLGDALLDAVDVLVVVLDREGNVIRFNRAAERLSGYSFQELQGSSIWNDLLVPEEIDDARAAFEQAAAGRRPERYENHWRCRDGSLCRISWTSTALLDRNGVVEYMIGTGTNVTEQRRLETERAAAHAKMRESQNLLQLVLDSIPVRVFWKDRNLNYLGCNRTAAIDAGVGGTDEIVGLDDFALRWANEAELYRADDRDVIDSGRPKINYEEPQTDPEGNERWLRTSKVPLKNPNGEIIGVMGCYEDITESRRTEEALRVSEARLHAAFGNLPFEFWLCDRDGRCVMQNAVSRDHWGDQRGRRPEDVDVPDDMRRLWITSTEKAFAGQLVQGEGTFTVEDEQVTFYSVLAPIRDAVGIQGVLGFNIDISDRKRAEEILRRQHEIVQSDLAKARDALVRQTRLATIGQVAASIAHELRNPLGAIRNASYYLRRRSAGDDPKWHEYLSMIDVEVAVSDRIISNLLELTRSKEPALQTVELGPAVRESFDRVRGASDAMLRCDADTARFTLSADPIQLRQVLVNLMTNSLQACDPGAEISVTATLQAGWSVITVSDNGPGIPEELREQVFEPLFSTKTNGTGLGLAICRQICEKHGGRIEAVRSPKAGGAIFRVRLPYPAARSPNPR